MKLFCVDSKIVYRDGVKANTGVNVAVFHDEVSARLWASVLNFAVNLVPGQGRVYEVVQRDLDVREVK